MEQDNENQVPPSSPMPSLRSGELEQAIEDLSAISESLPSDQVDAYGYVIMT